MTVTDVELDEIAEARTTWAEWCQSTPTSPSRPKERPLLMSCLLAPDLGIAALALFL